MVKAKQHSPLTPTRSPAVQGSPQSSVDQGVIELDDHMTMSEAAALLMEDEEAVVGVLTRAGVALIRQGDHSFVSRGDLVAYHARDIATRRGHLRELTRLSIEAGLDEADYSSLLPDPD